MKSLSATNQMNAILNPNWNPKFAPHTLFLFAYASIFLTLIVPMETLSEQEKVNMEILYQ